MKPCISAPILLYLPLVQETNIQKGDLMNHTSSHFSKLHRFFLIFSILTMVFGSTGCAPSTASALPSRVSEAVSISETISDSRLTVHVIDVGQGDSILIESKGHFMLVDAGMNDQAQTVTDYLNCQGVKTLDYVIGTHPDADHIGGLDAVINSFDVKQVFLPPKEHTTKTFEDVLDAIMDNGLTITKPVPGSQYQLGEASFTIVAPVGDYQDDLNNWSIGIRLTCQNRSFLFCGDAETQAEQDICASGADIQADVLKLSHHGSSTSSSASFLDEVNPSIALISCGKDNSYGHPHKEILAKMERRNITVLRTDQLGTIILSTDGNALSWTSEQGTEEEDSAAMQETSPQEESFVLNTNTRKFHLPDCSSVQQMGKKNRQEYTGTREELIQQGYDPCKNCNP